MILLTRGLALRSNVAALFLIILASSDANPTNFAALSVMVMNSSVGIFGGVTAKFDPYSSKERSLSSNWWSETIITHLSVTALISSCGISTDFDFKSSLILRLFSRSANFLHCLVVYMWSLQPAMHAG